MTFKRRFPVQSVLLACRGRPIQPVHSPITRSSITRRNASYQIPYLVHESVYEKEGIPSVFTREAYDKAWSQYHAYLLHNLNQMVGDETPPMITLMKRHARSAQHADIFNFASMAHNNHFFFEGMNPNPPEMRPELAEIIRDSFSSLESLRTTFIATADAMFGPGFVWLVKNISDNELNILTTYIAGSPYPAAHFRRQPVDMNNLTTNIIPGIRPYMLHQQTEALNAVVRGSAGSFGEVSRHENSVAGAAEIEPLLAVSTWEHTFIEDWGAWGKREFLEQWWEKIDWELVYNRARWVKGIKPF